MSFYYTVSGSNVLMVVVWFGAAFRKNCKDRWDTCVEGTFFQHMPDMKYMLTFSRFVVVNAITFVCFIKRTAS